MSEWKRVRIGDFLTERAGRYKPNDKEVLNLSRLNKIDFSGHIHLSDKPSKTDMIIVQPGDLVISGINVAKGAIAIHQGDKPICATIHYSSYIFNDKIIRLKYFKRFVLSQAFSDILKAQVKGGIKTEIKAKVFLKLDFYIPSLKQQDKIIKLFESIESDHFDLDSELTNQLIRLKQLRQTILQEAIEGKLTADWRKKNPIRKGDPNTDAVALLEKIKQDKQKLIAEGKIKKEKPLAPILDAEKPFELPKGWVWCRLEEIAETLSTGPFGSMLHKSDYVKDGIPIVNPTNILNRQIISDPRMQISKSTKERLIRYILQKDDIVIARRGNLEKCAVVCTEQTGWLCGTGSFFLRLLKINLDFFVLVYTSIKSQNYLLKDSIGQTMDNLNQKMLYKMLIGFPSLAEQQAIVERVDSLLCTVNDLEFQINERKNQSEMLMQAVLQESFEGENPYL